MASVVAPFYDALNEPAQKNVAALVHGITTPEWRSFSGESMSKGRDEFVAQVRLSVLSSPRRSNFLIVIHFLRPLFSSTVGPRVWQVDSRFEVGNQGGHRGRRSHHCPQSGSTHPGFLLYICSGNHV
jgi:hypothetical protein